MILKANWNWWVLKSETEICVKIGVIFESERLSDQIEVRYLTPDRRIDAALDQTGYLVHDKIWASLLDDKLALQHLIESSLSETKLPPGSDKNTLLTYQFWRKKWKKLQARKNREEAKAVQQQWGEEEAVLTERGRWVASKYSISMFLETDEHLLAHQEEGGGRRFYGGATHIVATMKIAKQNLSFFLFLASLSVFHDRQEKRRTEALEQTLLELTGEVDNYKWAQQLWGNCTLHNPAQCAMCDAHCIIYTCIVLHIAKKSSNGPYPKWLC